MKKNTRTPRFLENYNFIQENYNSRGSKKRNQNSNLQITKTT